MVYQVQLDTFQGPLELLYQLVKKNKIEISEISLARVTEQYLEYLEELKDFDLELASEFMVIASELLELKVRSLLPQAENDENDDQEDEGGSDLVHRLKEYHYFKRLSRILQDYQEKAAKRFTRPSGYEPASAGREELDLAIDLTELVEAFKKVMAAYRDKAKQEDLPLEEDWDRINSENIKIEDKVEFIMNRLAENPGGISFKELSRNCRNRLEIVVTFLSILELTKLCKIRVVQDKLFASINLIGKTG